MWNEDRVFPWLSKRKTRWAQEGGPGGGEDGLHYSVNLRSAKPAPLRLSHSELWVSIGCQNLGTEVVVGGTVCQQPTSIRNVNYLRCVTNSKITKLFSSQDLECL